MPSARKVLETKAAAKHEAVSDLAAEYLRHACKLGASENAKLGALCRTQLQPFFQLPEDVLSSLELSSIDTAGVTTRATGGNVASANAKAKRARGVLGPVLSPAAPAAPAALAAQAEKEGASSAQVRYFFDQEDTEGDEAYVQFTRRRKKEVVVVCPAKTHLRRRRYIRVLGTAISRHVGHLPSFTIRFRPAQLNGVAALACLGFYLVPKTSDSDELVFLAKRAWPAQKTKKKKLPPAQKFQFATVWVGGRFRASYFDLVKSEFRWAWRDSPFKAEVGTLKRRGALVLEAVRWPVIQALPLSTKVYGEYGARETRKNGGHSHHFFGTVGDLLSKLALLEDGSVGAEQLDQMQVRYLDPKKPAALVKFLNKREHALRPKLSHACLDKLPETALKNFAQVWTKKTIELVRKVLSRDANFLQHLVSRVPEDFREHVVPVSGPHSTQHDEVLSVAKILALYPSLAEALS